MWREKLIEALALVEAGIDFSDEGDVPKELVPKAIEIDRKMEMEIAEALAGQGEGNGTRGLMGCDRWAAQCRQVDAAQPPGPARGRHGVPHAGTTGDVIEVHLDLEGYPVDLLDPREFNEGSQDRTEREGMRRAKDVMRRADLVLWMTDAREMGADQPTRSPGDP